MADTELQRQFGAFYGLQSQHFGVNPRTCISQCLSPAIALVKGEAVIGDDRSTFGLHGDVPSPFQLGKRLSRCAGTDLQFLRQLLFSGQRMAVCKQPTFNAMDEFINCALFFVGACGFYHALSNSRA